MADSSITRDHIQDHDAAVVLAHHVLGMQMGTAMGQCARQLARQVLGIPDHGELAGCSAITTNGTLRIIPADEPVFLLRGQNVVAADTVRWWVEQAENVGAAPDIIAVALEHADRMEAWPKKKVADLSPALATGGARDQS